MQHEIYVYGPVDGGERRIQPASADWEIVNGEVQLWLSGPFGELGAASVDLFGSLYFLRNKLAEQGYLALVAGARRDAWHGTPLYPCAAHEARLYPVPGREPADTPVHVFAPCLEEATVELVVAPPEQWLYHRRGTNQPTASP